LRSRGIGEEEDQLEFKPYFSLSKIGGLDSQPVNAPTISITDENNRSLAPSSASYDPLAYMEQNTQVSPVISLTLNPKVSATKRFKLHHNKQSTSSYSDRLLHD
jgi:hypothetical protein